MDPVVLLAFVAGFIAFVCAFIASYQGRRFPRSIAKQAEQFRMAVDVERAMKESLDQWHVDRRKANRRRANPSVEESVTEAAMKSVEGTLGQDPYAAHPDGLDPATLTAAELQWLATSGLLPWAGEELARRTEQATELVRENLRYLHGLNDEQMKILGKQELECPAPLLAPKDDDPIEVVSFDGTRRVVLEKRTGPVTLPNGVTVSVEEPVRTGRGLITSRDVIEARAALGIVERYPDSRIRAEYDSAWERTDTHMVSVLADEIRRRGGRIDPYGRVVFPGDKVFRNGSLVDPDDVVDRDNGKPPPPGPINYDIFD